MNRHDNCINLIRIIAAFQVFYGHATAHLSLNMPTAIGYILSIIPGVPTFFLISGFLIWQSIDRTGYFGVFARKRIARLYPELWGGGCHSKCNMYSDIIQRSVKDCTIHRLDCYTKHSFSVLDT